MNGFDISVDLIKYMGYIVGIIPEKWVDAPEIWLESTRLIGG